MEKKIKKWLSEGLIDEATATKLLADVQEEKERSRKTKINITIYTVAIVFLGLGIISFIAANSWILALLEASDLVKILLMLLATLGSLWGGYNLAYEKNSFPKLGNALILLACFLIGGTYSLVGQIYNINANCSELFFLWLLSILPLAYLFRSFAINVFSIVLFILGVIYFYLDLSLDNAETWTIFIPILTGLALYTFGNIPAIIEKYNNFSFSYKITGALPIFITLLILTCSVESSYQLTSLYYYVPLVLLMVLVMINYHLQKEPTMLLKIETYSTVALLAFLLLVLVLPHICIPLVIILSNLAIIAMIVFGFNYGYKFEKGNIIAITNWILTIYVLVNYCRWGWSFMNKSLFFIFGGITMLTLGLYLEKKRKTIVKGEK